METPFPSLSERADSALESVGQVGQWRWKKQCIWRCQEHGVGAVPWRPCRQLWSCTVLGRAQYFWLFNVPTSSRSFLLVLKSLFNWYVILKSWKLFSQVVNKKFLGTKIFPDWYWCGFLFWWEFPCILLQKHQFIWLWNVTSDSTKLIELILIWGLCNCMCACTLNFIMAHSQSCVDTHRATKK